MEKGKWFTEGFEFKSQKCLNFRFLWDSNSWPFISETSDLSIRPRRQGGGREKNIVVTLNFIYLVIDLLNLTLKYETKMKIDFQMISKFHNCIDSSCNSLKQLNNSLIFFKAAPWQHRSVVRAPTRKPMVRSSNLGGETVKNFPIWNIFRRPSKAGRL